MTGIADLAPARTPDKPGPGPLPEAALRSLDLAVRRRVDSVLSGEFRSSQLGVATELAQVRPYEPGDDVRQIDWLATARTNEPHVRVHVAERALTTWLLIDRSASMQFGTADRRKADVAEGVALALGHVASRRGNRLGVITSGAGAAASRRPRQGRAGLLAALLALRFDETVVHDKTTALRDGFEYASRVARQRALLVVVERPARPARLGGAAGTTRRPPRRADDRGARSARGVARGRRGADAGRSGHRRTGPRGHPQPPPARALRRGRSRGSGSGCRDVRRAGADHVVLSTHGEWLRPLLVALARRDRRAS